MQEKIIQMQSLLKGHFYYRTEGKLKFSRNRFQGMKQNQAFLSGDLKERIKTSAFKGFFNL